VKYVSESLGADASPTEATTGTKHNAAPFSGKSDAQIQLISGHESKKSLEIYQHLSLGAVELAYQEAKADGKGGF